MIGQGQGVMMILRMKPSVSGFLVLGESDDIQTPACVCMLNCTVSEGGFDGCESVRT